MRESHTRSVLSLGGATSHWVSSHSVTARQTRFDVAVGTDDSHCNAEHSVIREQPRSLIAVGDADSHSDVEQTVHGEQIPSAFENSLSEQVMPLLASEEALTTLVALGTSEAVLFSMTFADSDAEVVHPVASANRTTGQWLFPFCILPPTLHTPVRIEGGLRLGLAGKIA